MDQENNLTLNTIVYIPNYFDQTAAFRGKAKSVSGINAEGPFDILPEHENFVTTIKDKLTIIDTKDKKIEFPLGKGLIEATNNQVKVFIEF